MFQLSCEWVRFCFHPVQRKGRGTAAPSLSSALLCSATDSLCSSSPIKSAYTLWDQTQAWIIRYLLYFLSLEKQSEAVPLWARSEASWSQWEVFFFFLFKLAEGCTAARAFLHTLSWRLDFGDTVANRLIHAQTELLVSARMRAWELVWKWGCCGKPSSDWAMQPGTLHYHLVCAVLPSSFNKEDRL